jgi:hypothetical protein
VNNKENSSCSPENENKKEKGNLLRDKKRIVGMLVDTLATV